MESELVAGLCELWLNFSFNSSIKTKEILYFLGLLSAYLSFFINQISCNTLSWVLGLIQYRNNNLNNIIGILSDLYWMLIKYVGNIINPLNRNFRYKKVVLNINLLKLRRKSKWCYNLIELLNIKFYIWTSKNLDPSERYTPYMEIIFKKNYKVIINNQIATINNQITAINNEITAINNEIITIIKNSNIIPNPTQWVGLGMIFISIGRNPVFDNLSFNFATSWNRQRDGKIKTFSRIDIYIYAKYKKFLLCVLYNKILQYILKLSKSLLIKKGDLSCTELNSVFYNSLRKKPVFNHSLIMNKGLNNSEGKIINHILKYKSSNLLKLYHGYNLPTSKEVGKFKLPLRSNGKIKRMVINVNKVKDKITEKNKTKSRSNKWKFIISEKSRKLIILGCKGKTYLEKLQNFYNTWWNYYIIRECNSSKILYEYHSPIKKNENWKRYSSFNAPLHIFPAKIKNFLNCSNIFINSNLENKITIINDIKLDKFTELNSYYRNTQKKEMNYFNIIKAWKEGMDIKALKDTESNIEQYYSFCNNSNVYVGWVSIIKIRNYSSQPTYYNNLIKRYHKDWLFILKKLVGKPNYNMKCNSNIKMNDTNLPSSLIDIKEEGKPSPTQYLEKNPGQTKIWANSTNNENEIEPIIPIKYKKVFDTEIITIKKFTREDYDKTQGYPMIRIRNKLPWRLKEYLVKKEDQFIKGFVKISAKYR
jgi:hypothetical protein